MKKIVAGMCSLMLASSLTLAAPVVYNDVIGDLDATLPDDFSGFAHLDIDSVTIDNDATSLFITLAVVQSPITAPADWGNYMIAFDTVAGGDTGSPIGNPWGRPIAMTTGMDAWVGSWVNGGGGHQVWNFSGTWSELPGSPRPVVLAANTVSYTIPLSDLGLGVGDTFTFDVYASGGPNPDPAVDALSSATPSATTWTSPYDTGANGLSYTVVPEPSSLALLGAAGLMVMARRFRRK